MSALESVESRRLLNGAFLGAILTTSADGFYRLSRNGLPFFYSYIVLALVLHAETRQRLPTTVATRLVTWTERNGDIVSLFPARVADLAPFTSRGILTAVQAKMAELSTQASLIPLVSDKDLAAFGKQSGSSEVAEILKKANFIGKWLAAAGTQATVATALGVRLES